MQSRNHILENGRQTKSTFTETYLVPPMTHLICTNPNSVCISPLTHVPHPSHPP
jgi:hypothetical protein